MSNDHEPHVEVFNEDGILQVRVDGKHCGSIRRLATGHAIPRSFRTGEGPLFPNINDAVNWFKGEKLDD